MPTLRPAAVAGLFYPAEPRALTGMVDALMQAAPPARVDARALIAPHAGFIYSGAVAASAYGQLRARAAGTRRVLLLGPSHRVAFTGMALSSAQAFACPAGDMAVDTEACRDLLRLPQVEMLDEAHAEEHSLEVHLPFLRAVLGDVPIIPVVVGDAGPEQVATVIRHFWDDDETLVVVSSDLSHFLDYEHARQADAATTRAIEHLEQTLQPRQACGCRPINGLMRVAADYHLRVTTLEVRNSGDTAGDRARVVGYGAYALS